ncbi:MAG: adenosylhomocysteinase [Selenomonadaceae bacterium]|nr:adenosylhomocysteinase [Selenomonadaceae bacterium]
MSLAASGADKINWVKNFMPVMNYINDKYGQSKPFAGLNVTICLHLEAKTAYMAQVFHNAGANVSICGSNPLSTQDDVCAGLAQSGVNVFATHACSDEEYFTYIEKSLENPPHIIIDDGGDLVHLLHTKRKDLIANLYGGSEETTTGVNRLKKLDADGELAFPMIAANDAYMKFLFDNRYGTGQSTFDGIMRTTNLVIAGKTVVIAGYGWCGKGAAMRARGLGANVVITEVDPIKSIEAVFDGFRVMPMSEAAKIGDLFLTLTGCSDVINKNHFELMKEGAMLANAGHFDVEINIPELAALSTERKTVKPNIEQFSLKNGKRVYLLAEGRLVNLASGDGHPAEVMDLSFAVQFFSALHILNNHESMQNHVYLLPENINIDIAKIKLKALGVEIDTLTDEQRKYLGL